MINDRQITITIGASRKSVSWQPQVLWLSELYRRLETPARGTESYAAYMQSRKPEQDEKKDVGGFVGGALRGTRRKAGAVCSRDLVTLDLDNLPPGGTEDVLRRVAGLACGYCVYSTRKHTPEAPRLRVVVPVSRAVSPDEYEPCARKLAELIQLEMTWFDQTTFEASRLMYWPSCCADSTYVYQCEDKPFLDADGVLGLYGGAWQDVTAWPQVPGARDKHARLAAKQQDPTTKQGVVGAFCRAYDITAAMERFLPGVYESCDLGENRYTFLGGSTAGGAVVYDDGKWLYSHHATDPCSGQLVNAFDLVRLHLFGELDDDAKPGTPVNKLPSFARMGELAVSDDVVGSLLAQERFAAATNEFECAPSMAEGCAPTLDWMKNLKASPKTGRVDSTMDNIWQILEHDPNLVGKFAINEFAGRGEVLGVLPWDGRGKRRLWEDNDNQGLYWYLEKVYQVTGLTKIDGALSLHSNRHAFNDVADYLNGLQWDGTPRLETLLIDYLGAEDTPYTRTATRKMFAAAVARALQPGTKFDSMMILGGPQGIGKSTLISILSKGWFNDSIRTFEGKDASELLQGVWLVEIGELDAFRQSGISRIKQFLSLQHDRFRAAYGKHVKDLPRRCVFFGTTNTAEYLRDKTGNRRFWPVDVGVRAATKSVWQDLAQERDQLWAEAVVYFRIGEPLYLAGALETAAKDMQESHRERSAQEGIIRDFLEQAVPTDWNGRDLQQRNMFWAGTVGDCGELSPRTKVCALEIWCEALSNDARAIKNSDTAEINSILAMLPEWRRMDKPSRFGYCKVQRGFEKIQVLQSGKSECNTKECNTKTLQCYKLFRDCNENL